MLQMREELYQTLGAMATQVAGFYQMTAVLPGWAATLVGDVHSMPNQHLRLLTRHVIIPLIKACPPAHRCSFCWPTSPHAVPSNRYDIDLTMSMR